MSVLTKEFLKNRTSKANNNILYPSSIWEAYMNYATSKENEKVLWYMKVIMFMTCAVMIPSIFAMGLMTPNYIWFIEVTIVLFFTNVIVHIAEAKSTVYIPLYHASNFIMIIIPFVTYLIS